MDNGDAPVDPFQVSFVASTAAMATFSSIYFPFTHVGNL